MTDKPIYWLGSSKEYSKQDIQIGQQRYKQMLKYRQEQILEK